MIQQISSIESSDTHELVTATANSKATDCVEIYRGYRIEEAIEAIEAHVAKIPIHKTVYTIWVTDEKTGCELRLTSAIYKGTGLAWEEYGKDMVKQLCAAQYLKSRYKYELSWFISLMDEKLRLNEHKKCFLEIDVPELIDLLCTELTELNQAIKNGKLIQYEAADVANFAMMIAFKARKEDIKKNE